MRQTPCDVRVRYMLEPLPLASRPPPRDHLYSKSDFQFRGLLPSSHGRVFGSSLSLFCSSSRRVSAIDESDIRPRPPLQPAWCCSSLGSPLSGRITCRASDNSPLHLTAVSLFCAPASRLAPLIFFGFFVDSLSPGECQFFTHRGPPLQ